jgi:hypothetical protein
LSKVGARNLAGAANGRGYVKALPCGFRKPEAMPLLFYFNFKVTMCLLAFGDSL